MQRLQHPYLFFSAAELPALRNKVQKPFLAQRWRLLVRNADWYLKQPLFGIEKSRWALGACGVSGFAYAMLRREEYGLRAKREALRLLSAKRWHKGYSWNRGADLDSSEAAMACAFVYDWCRDLFSASEARDFRRRLLELSTRVYLRSVEEYKDWWFDNPVTNWSGVCHGGHGLAAFAMYDEEPLARRAADIAWKHLQRFLRTVSGIDGDGHEGVMYNLYGVSFGNICAAAAARIHGSDGGLYADYTRKRAGHWIIYLKGPDGQYANFNNMDEATFGGASKTAVERGPMAMLCALYESKVPGGDALLRWGADAGGAAFYYKGAAPFDFIFRSGRPAVKEKPKLAPAVLFRSGHAVLQSDQLWLAFNAGWTSNSSHCNRDLGTFVLTWNGTRLISDPGYGFTAAADHSTLLAGKSDQICGARAKYLRFGSGRGFHYFAADITKAYPGWLKKFVRHGVMVGGRYLVLLDDVAIQGPGRCDLEVRFQTRGKISVAKSQPRAQIRSGNAAMHVIAALPADAQVAQSRATLGFVSVQPYVRRHQDVFLSVLYPGAPSDSAPKVRVEQSGSALRLRVNRDVLKFAKMNSRWMLASVNGASAARIPDGSQQTVFRK